MHPFTKRRSVQLPLDSGPARRSAVLWRQLILLALFMSGLVFLGLTIDYLSDVMPSYESLKALTTSVKHYDQLPPFDDASAPIRPRPQNSNKGMHDGRTGTPTLTIVQCC